MRGNQILLEEKKAWGRPQTHLTEVAGERGKRREVAGGRRGEGVEVSQGRDPSLGKEIGQEREKVEEEDHHLNLLLLTEDQKPRKIEIAAGQEAGRIGPGQGPLRDPRGLAQGHVRRESTRRNIADRFI